MGITKEYASKQMSTYQYLDSVPLPAMVTLGTQMIFEFANDLALELLKGSTKEPHGKSVLAILPDIFTQDILKEIHKTCFMNKQACFLEERHIVYVQEEKPRILWVDIKNSPLFDDQGAVIGIMTFFTDVSERVISKKSIDQHVPHLGNFFKHAPIGLICYRGQDFIVDFANDMALQMWGKSFHEVKGKPIHEIFPEVVTDPEISSRHAESLNRLKRGETHVVKEVALTFVKNGKPETGWYTYIHEPYTNVTGEVIGMMAIAIEVTDQVLARKKLQLVTDAIPSLVSYVNNKEEYELVNRAYQTWFKRSPAEVVGKTISDVVGNEAYATIRPHIEKALSGQVDTFESWVDYANHNRKFVSASYIPHIDNNHVLGYIGLVNDLTERKMQEEALLENEARLRLITEGVGAGTFEYNLESGEINWSDELKVLLGLPKDLIINKEIARSVVHPDDLSSVLSQSNNLTMGGKDEYMAIDYRIIRKDTGEIRWLHSRSRIFGDKVSGKQVPTRVIGFSIDITDRKIAEEKFRELSESLEVKVNERTVEVSRINDLLQQRNEDLNKAQSVLQQLIDSSIELIAVVDRDLKFLAVNKAFEEFVHKSRSELIGKEIFVAYEGARGSRQVEVLQKVFAGETLHLKVNPSIARPNVWFDTHYVPLVVNGKVEGVIALSRDISDIIKSERELANVNRQLQEAQRLAKLGSWEWDVTTGTVIWSDEMYHIYGYEEKFPVDFVKATERMSPEDADRSSKRTQEYIQQAIENFRSNGETVHEVPSSEIRIQLPGGEIKLLRNTGKIQLTSDGKLHRFLGVLQDVTEIRSAEAKLQQLIDELNVKNRELESFNYVASHDLKEPLRNIRMMIDLIRVKKTEDNSAYLGKIDRAAERMFALIESILKLSEVSNIAIEFSQVDLNKVIEICRADLESRIKDTNTEIIVEKLPIVSGNESQINQVFLNLLSNSMKFCKTMPKIEITCAKISGHKLRSVFPAAEVNNDYWRISISDNGIGFDPRFKQQIFEPFQRLHGKREYPGTGIGLSIVKKIIEKHNGFIDADSQVSVGAKFSVWLPVKLQIERQLGKH